MNIALNMNTALKLKKTLSLMACILVVINAVNVTLGDGWQRVDPGPMPLISSGELKTMPSKLVCYAVEGTWAARVCGYIGSYSPFIAKEVYSVELVDENGARHKCVFYAGSASSGLDTADIKTAISGALFIKGVPAGDYKFVYGGIDCGVVSIVANGLKAGLEICGIDTSLRDFLNGDTGVSWLSRLFWLTGQVDMPIMSFNVHAGNSIYIKVSAANITPQDILAASLEGVSPSGAAGLSSTSGPSGPSGAFATLNAVIPGMEISFGIREYLLKLDVVSEVTDDATAWVNVAGTWLEAPLVHKYKKSLRSENAFALDISRIDEHIVDIWPVYAWFGGWDLDETITVQVISPGIIHGYDYLHGQELSLESGKYTLELPAGIDYFAASGFRYKNRNDSFRIQISYNGAGGNSGLKEVQWTNINLTDILDGMLETAPGSNQWDVLTYYDIYISDDEANAKIPADANGIRLVIYRDTPVLRDNIYTPNFVSQALTLADKSFAALPGVSIEYDDSHVSLYDGSWFI
jgi:hypothetical protein